MTNVKLMALFGGCGLYWLIVGVGAAKAEPPEESTAAATAPAAESPKVIVGEIVVTANKREERLQAVPATIQATTGSELRARQITTNDQLMNLVPDLRVGSSDGALGQDISIRGIGPANNFNFNVEAPVGLYMDEIYQPLPAAPGTQLFDLARIEVLKGPQGTLYGRNTTGGAINYVSQKPTLHAGEDNGSVEVGYGNYSRFEIQGATDLTFIDDVFGARVAFFHNNRDGYTENVGSAGPNTFGSSNTTAGRIIVLYRPNGHFDATLGVYENDFSGSIDAPIAFSTRSDGTILGQYSRAGLSNYQDALNFVRGNKAETTNVGLTMNDRIGDVKLTSITSFGHVSAAINNDCDASPLLGCQFAGELSDTQASQDLRAEYSTSSFHVTGGVSYGWDKQPEDTAVSFGDGTAYLTNLRNTFTQFRTTYGMYIDGAYSFTDALQLELGLRDTQDQTTMSKVRSDLLDMPLGSPIAPLIPLQGNVSRSSNGVSGRAIVSYKFTPDIMAYASYSRGYRSGAFNGTQFFAASELNYVGPETTDQEEVGVKATLARRFTVDLSLFNINITNQQVQSTVNIPACDTCNPPTPPAKSQGLAGLNGYSRGMDLAIEAQLLDNLKGSLSVTLLDTKYASGATQNISGVSVAGKRFPFSPDAALRAGLDWTAWREGDQKVTLGTNVSYTGRYFFDPTNGALDRPGGVLRDGQGPYVTADARIAYEVGRVRVSVWANNIFDNHYIVYAADVSSFDQDQAHFGEPRTFGGSIAMKF